MLSLKIPLEKGSKKLINAWAFYDWANSVYPLVISSAIFPIYFGALFSEINTIAVFGYDVKNTAMISFVTAAAFLVVALMSPILSGIADYMGNKKFFLKLFCYIGAISCMSLYFFSLDNLILSIVSYLFALIGFWGSLVFYNSFLLEIADKDQHDRISAKGFSMGYIGSVLLLVTILALSQFMKVME